MYCTGVNHTQQLNTLAQVHCKQWLQYLDAPDGNGAWRCNILASASASSRSWKFYQKIPGLSRRCRNLGHYIRLSCFNQKPLLSIWITLQLFSSQTDWYTKRFTSHLSQTGSFWEKSLHQMTWTSIEETEQTARCQIIKSQAEITLILYAETSNEMQDFRSQYRLSNTHE